MSVQMSARLLLLLTALLIPSFSYGHETRQYEIDGVPYELVIGSVGEPVVVDDKTGVHLEIVRDGVYVTGAEEYLELELIAGETSRVQKFTPQYGTEGVYRSKFIATEATSLTYRVFGQLEGVPIDFRFTCHEGGHHESAETDSLERKVISEKVVETLRSGSFSCPESKKELGFPLPTEDIAKLTVSSQGESHNTHEDTPPLLMLWLLAITIIVGTLFFRRTT